MLEPVITIVLPSKEVVGSERWGCREKDMFLFEIRMLLRGLCRRCGGDMEGRFRVLWREGRVE